MGKTILIVDGDAGFAKVSTFYLRDISDNIVYFKNPIDAIQWLNEGNWADLIVADAHTPEVTGEEFLKYMKKTHSTSLFHS